MPEPSRRLFFALSPPQDLSAQIELATRTQIEASGGRPIPSRNFHVTLVFVGEVPPSSVPAMLAAGTAVASSPAFGLSFDRIDAWPESRVLVLRVAATPPELLLLVERLRFSLLTQQINLKHQVYRPHLTLARNLPHGRSSERLQADAWAVKEYELMESTPTRGGSEYRTLERWPLA